MLNAWDAVSTLDRMLDDVMGSAFGTATNSRSFEPAIDVHASEDEVLFHCDVPGVKQQDLEITLENHVLTIKGTRKFNGSERQQTVLGRPYGAFSRSFTLPETLDEENLNANLSEGVLTIRIPKSAKAKPRRIEIGSGSDQKQLKETNER